MRQDLPVFSLELTEDAKASPSAIRLKAIRLQIVSERRAEEDRENARWLLERLKAEGESPVWDALCAALGDPFNGNSTINRRLRAYAGNRAALSERVGARHAE